MKTNRDASCLTLKLAKMETSIAVTGKGYAIVAADTTAARSIVKMKDDEDKIKAIAPHLLMTYSGEPGESRLLIIFTIGADDY